MSDADLRELERRFRETGSVEDEAAWLLERVRVGELTEERLELAAYCGHRAAAVALGPDAPHLPEDLRLWGEGLAPYGKWVAASAAVAAARLALPLWTAAQPHDQVVRQALEHAVNWVACPCEDHAVAAFGGVESAANLAGEQSGAAWAAACAVSSAAEAVILPSSVAAAEAAGHAAFDAAYAVIESRQDENLVREAFRAALVPSALGYSDSVRERVKARQREAAE